MQCKHCDTEIEMVGGRWQHVAPADEKYPQDCPGDELDELAEPATTSRQHHFEVIVAVDNGIPEGPPWLNAENSASWWDGTIFDNDTCEWMSEGDGDDEAGTLLEGWLRAGTAAVEIARHLARREEWSSSDLDVIADILVRAGLFKPEGPMAAVAGVAREPMLSLDQLADLAWDKVPTEAEHASIIEHFRSTPPESAYAQARHAGWVKAYAWLAARAERDTSGAYMLTKRLAERYPDEYSEVTG